MSSPLRIGLTGGIGSGKSTAAGIFNLLGVPIYDADARAKQLMGDNEKLIRNIKLEFGEESYQNGKLNRQYLAEKVFADNNQVEKLNAIVHPAVAEDFNIWCSNQNAHYVIKEAALLFENGSYKHLDNTILVIAPLELRVQRIKLRDSTRSDQQINHIISKQIDVEEAKRHTDMYIINDEATLLIPQVLKLNKDLKEKSPIR